MRDQATILSDLASILSNFQGREYSEPITAETRFFGDLGLVSIDAVVLGETLETYYGQKIPFQLFLTQLTESQVQDIVVGQLAEFLSSCLESPAN